MKNERFFNIFNGLAQIKIYLKDNRDDKYGRKPTPPY